MSEYVIDPDTLSPPPRAVRLSGPLQKRRIIRTTLLAMAVLVGLIVLGFFAVRRIAFLHNAIQTTGTVTDHHITSGKSSRFTLFVDFPPSRPTTSTQIDVDSETYDATWIGQPVSFFVDPNNTDITSQDAPSGWKIAGCILGSFMLGTIIFCIIAAAIWDLDLETKESRRSLREDQLANLTVTQVVSLGVEEDKCLATGAYVDHQGKKGIVTGMRVPHMVKIGESIPILYREGEGKARALESVTGVELV